MFLIGLVRIVAIGHYRVICIVNEYDTYLKELGDRIRLRREALSLNQIRFADEVGIGERHLRRIEKGKANPTLEVLFNMCKTLKTGLAELL